MTETFSLVDACSCSTSERGRKDVSSEYVPKQSNESIDSPRHSKERHDSSKKSKELTTTPLLSREAGHTPRYSKESLSIRKRWKDVSPRYSKEDVGASRRSKESSSRQSPRKLSKELAEEKSSLQRRLRLFASLTGFKSQKTQADVHDESYKSDAGKKGIFKEGSTSLKRKPDERKMTSSSRRRKIFAGLRKKESQKIPVREVEPPRLSDTTHAHCEIVDVRELQHKIKLRQKQLRVISDIMCCVSITAIIACLTIALLGLSACYIAHIEYTVQKAAALQMGKQWKSQCGRKKLQRMIYDGVYEETNCSLPSIATAKWSAWSKCLKGKRSRWKIMEKNRRYIFDKDFYEQQLC